MRFFSECGDFFREYRRHVRTTGAILPSSRFLAHALASELRKPRGPSRILEVGPGTGSVTTAILRELHPADRLDLVELNGRFIAYLQRRFDEEWLFHFHRDQVRLIHSAVEALPGEEIYDLIVSSLPLNNFSVAQVRDVFRAYRRLLRPGGTLTYFEYVFIRQLKTPFVGRRERRRLYRIGRLVGRYIESYQVRREQVFMNVPPAIVRHLHLKPVSSDAEMIGCPTGFQRGGSAPVEKD
ncbi:MAG: methyltransferase domain-containing protein [Gemmataceae bacterium]|nr:methyltransferase domain-containing protein [Gemmataceae bacterium]MDW8265967.1 methyltransferase domain-containing protein [Gemmataceae bacterium]